MHTCNISETGFIFRSLLCHNTGIFALWAVHVTLSIGFSLAIQDVHLNFHSFHALPHVFMQLAYCCCLKVSAGKAGTAGPFLLLMIALLPLSRLIRVDVQNVRRMFYGLLRNHSPAQVTQCSAMQERGGREEKIRGLYS